MRELQLTEINNTSAGVNLAHLPDAILNGCMTAGMTFGGISGALLGVKLAGSSCIGLTFLPALGTTTGAMIGTGTGLVIGTMAKVPPAAYYHIREFLK